ncbi:MAG: PilN domain-containing protein [Porticoccaceae bacterium]
MMLEKQQVRNAYITNKSVEMNESTAEINRQKNKRQQILSVVQVIQDLQHGRTEIVRVFDELARAVPDGVYLTKLERVAETVTLYGFAESNYQLSVLIRNLQQSVNYDNANLIKVQHSGRKLNQTSAFNFQLIIGPSTSRDPNLRKVL